MDIVNNGLPDFDSKKAELERLIESVLKDNKITDMERNLLLKKAKEVGYDLDVFELELDNRLAEKQKNDLYELVDQYLKDGELDDKERSFLIEKALSIGLDALDFEAYLDRKIKSVVRNNTADAASSLKRKGESKDSKDNVSNNKKFKLIVAVFAAVILASAGLVVATIYANNHEQKPIDLGVYVRNNPQLIFQTVSFSKYVIMHTPKGTNEHLKRETAYHVRATGKYYFDLSNLVVDDKNTNTHKRILYLNYNSPTAFPVGIDIDINQSDITKIESFDPTPVTESEAVSIAKPTSYIAGGIGALVGVKLGGEIGSKFGKIGTLVGATFGTVSLGTSAAQMTYVRTKDFFTELKLTSGYNIEKEEAMLFGVKQLLAAEMLNINFSNNQWESDTKTYYQNAMERSLSKALQKFGWNEVHIQFNCKNSDQSVESK